MKKLFFLVCVMMSAMYNRQNELCIFLKRKVHFFDTISHENEQLISQLLIFYIMQTLYPYFCANNTK